MAAAWDPLVLALWAAGSAVVAGGLACAWFLPPPARAESTLRRVPPEAVWAAVALAAVVAAAVPATRARLDRLDAGGADVTIEVRASQWRWEYDYLDQMGERRFGFVSASATPEAAIYGSARRDEHYPRTVDRPLVIPAQRKVRLIVTSDDVVHAFWIPGLGLRAEAVPGLVRTVWVIPDAPGTYRGQCAAFCGEGHGFMPAVVEVRTPQAFDDWQREAAATLVAETPNAAGEEAGA